MSNTDKIKGANLRKRSVEAKARKVSATTSDSTGDDTTDDAGNQFGRNSHKKAKA